MEGPASKKLNGFVLPGQTVDISIDFQAPELPGRYIGFWGLRNSLDDDFGFESNLNDSIWLKIDTSFPIIGFTSAPQ